MYDPNTCLLIQLIGISVFYQPVKNNKQAGTLMNSDGSNLDITSRELIGWAVVPLFEGSVVFHQTHRTFKYNRQLIDSFKIPLSH